MSRKNKNSYLKSKEFKVHQFKILKYEIVQKNSTLLLFKLKMPKIKTKVHFSVNPRNTHSIFFNLKQDLRKKNENFIKCQKLKKSNIIFHKLKPQQFCKK